MMVSILRWLKNLSRIEFLRLSITAAFGVLILTLFSLQIVHNKEYQAAANKEQTKQYELTAKRGLIYAMDGKKPIKLVMNEPVYTLFVDPEEAKKNKSGVFDTILPTLRQIAGGNLKSNAGELLKKENTRYQVLGTNLNRSQAEAIKKKKFAGIGVTEGSRRVYPEGQLASQILGFVNTEGGKYGIEETFNTELSGKNGLIKSTTDVFGSPLEIGDENIDQRPTDGKNIVLSIDRNVQAKVEKVLKERLEASKFKNGSVIVMNPKTGKIMAMANYPTYNPAEYNKVQNGAVFNNDASIMPYENGSIIKSFTMAVGINEGVASANATYYNTDRIEVDDRIIQNLAKGHLGTITYQTAMDNSLNTGMVTIAKNLGGGSINRTARDKIYDYFYNKFGLGQKTGLEVPEAKGLLISPDKAEGNAVRYSNMTFGQGMDLTMVQTATAFCSLVNGGTVYKASLINGEIDADGNFIEKDAEVRASNVITESTSQQMRQILMNVRKHNGGKDGAAGYSVGGKTGTSQTVVNGKYVDNQTIASYLGFGGGDEAEYVIMVSVWGEGQNPQGGRDAGPIFTDISDWMLNYLAVKPKKG